MCICICIYKNVSKYLCITWYNHMYMCIYIKIHTCVYTYVNVHHATSSADQRRFTDIAGAKMDGFTIDLCHVLEQSASNMGQSMGKTHSIM